MAEFSTITVNELLSRIQRLETQVSICIQNQELLFQQASNCQLAQECLKFAKEDVDQPQLLTKKIGTRTGTTNETKCSSQLSCRLVTPTTRRETPWTPSPLKAARHTQARIQPARPQGMQAHDGDEIGGSTEINDFLREIEIIDNTGPELSPANIGSDSELRAQLVAQGPSLSTQPQRQQQKQRQRKRPIAIFERNVCQKCGKTFCTPGFLGRHIRESRCTTPKSTWHPDRFQGESYDASYGYGAQTTSSRVHQSTTHEGFPSASSPDQHQTIGGVMDQNVITTGAHAFEPAEANMDVPVNLSFDWGTD